MDAKNIITSHLGLIMGVVITYWWKLPLTVRMWYDVDDMLHDCITHVLRVTHRYNRRRAGVSTFLHVATRNCCRDILEHHSQKKRSAAVVSLDELESNRNPTHRQHNLLSYWQPQWQGTGPEARLRAKENFEVLLQFGTDELRQTLTDILDGHMVGKFRLRAAQEEVTMLKRRFGLNSGDVVRCLVLA